MSPMDERELARAAERLGETAASEIDIDRVAERVAARLQSGERIATGRRARWWMTAAAAAAVLGVAGYQWLSPAGPEDLRVAQVTAVPELDILSGDELIEVLDSLTLQAPVTEVVTATLDDLTEQQLVELLAIMEG